MFSIIKKYSAILAIISLMILPTANAQSLTEKGSNLVQFLGLQFDVSDILEDYKANLLLNDNTCKQTDRFAILDAQDQITNNLLQNYDQITSENQAELIEKYQVLEVELEFLREVDILTENQDFTSAQNLLKSRVKKNLNERFSSLVDNNFQAILNKYENRYRIYDTKTDTYKEGTYLNCPTSWSSISARADKISQEVTKIQEEWEQLSNALDKVKKTSKKTFSPSNIKRLAIKSKDEIVKGTSQSIQNLKSEAHQLRKEAYQIGVKPLKNYQQALSQNQSLLSNRNDIRSLLLSDKPITDITEEFNQRADLQQVFQTSIIQNTAIQVTLQHSDAGYYSIINNAYQSPAILEENLQIFQEEDGNGLLAKSKQVYNQQCSI